MSESAEYREKRRSRLVAEIEQLRAERDRFAAERDAYRKELTSLLIWQERERLRDALERIANATETESLKGIARAALAADHDVVVVPEEIELSVER